MIAQVHIESSPGSYLKILAKQIKADVWECPICNAHWTVTWLSQSLAPNCCSRLIFVTRATKWNIPLKEQEQLQMSGNARIWWDSSVSAYRMTVPFNPQFNELFKNLMPHSDRNWDRDAKIWTITERYFEPTKTLLTKMFGNIVIIDRATSEKASQPTPVKTAPIDNVLVQFAKLLPYEAMRKAYLVAAQQLHPDKGGDMGKMTDLNACWQRLEAEFYKKGG